MRQTIEQLMLEAAPATTERDKQFTARVMRGITQTKTSEIFSRQLRTMNDNNKESFTMKLRHLPRFAAIALAAASLLLVSGTAYAIYSFWPKPSVSITSPEENQYKRTQLIASFKDCGEQNNNATFEIKKGSTLKPAEVSKILQAKCERILIEHWMQQQNMPSDMAPPATRTDGIHEGYSLSSVASKVVSISPTSLSLTGDEWNSPKEPLTLSSETKYIANGAEARAEDIKPGDSVLFITKLRKEHTLEQVTPTNQRLHSKLLDKKVTHIIKVDLPFEYYGPSKENQIVERQACSGNPQDTCLNGASMEMYANLETRPDLNADILSGKSQYKSIEGQLTHLEGNDLQLTSSSGRVFTLRMASDIVAAYNAAHPDLKVAAGDQVSVTYVAPPNEDSLELSHNRITNIGLMLDLISKSDELKKY